MKVSAKGEYYGAMRHEQNQNGILLSEYDYSGPRTDWHCHENPYLMYVLRGNLLDINSRNKTHCDSGSLLFFNWDEPHYNSKHSENARGFHIEFERDWFKNKKLDLNLWEGSQLIENPGLHHLLAKLYFEFKCDDSYSEISIELLLLQLCENIKSISITESNLEPSWMKRLKEILHKTNDYISLAGLSNELGVHPVHISRAVPKYLKTTLGSYIRQQKVKKAIGYMNSNLSLTSISHICGFSDQSHFIRLFKIYIGTTPKKYRKRIR